ncbi:MAG: hypothetical protein AAF404_22500 [Pseudomonadota bacterium]
MQKISTLPTAVFCSVLLLHGCAVTEPEVSTPPTPVATIKPDIDYSGTSPDCQTAGERIAANVIVGMPLSEVRRLVGKPAYRFPGSWWWSGSFDKAGRPYIQYDAVTGGSSDARVTEVSADTEKC